MSDLTVEVTTTHEKFNAGDADVIIQSSDGVQFHLHRRYLEAYTGAFPGLDAPFTSDTLADVTCLTESAEILEILFEFVYPRRHPNLEDLEFKTLALLAEAVEKYEVFSAMTICELRLKPFIPTYATEILVHGIKHDYPKFVNEAALHLSRMRLPLHKFLGNLPGNAIFPWVHYHEAWKDVFEAGIRSIRLDESQGPGVPSDTACEKCRGLILALIFKLERVSSLSLLVQQLDSSTEHIKNFPICKNCPHPKTAINSADRVIKICKKGVHEMRPFTDFMLGKVLE
ncbi:hypothetical protein GALMADRAFT_215610 [Galerina marginata CBS 339.88]|uniref:BTB domain-containing protein n=1 Tax=Galerina marginata (strain CBS 339.88) TaxID=685588 RepID=A0A067SM05_GALM3|nr:hypothetical protein GALMADRAFT_215610 [Galerina marginata CBS 339.88]